MVWVSEINKYLGRGIARRVLFVSLIALFGASLHAQPPETLRKTSTAISPERLSSSFAEVAKRVEPAVVNIDTKTKPPEIAIRGGGEDRSRDIEEFLKRNLPDRAPAYAVGSGFIVDPEGHIVTNYHVVKGAEKITVKLQNGDEYIAKVLGADEETDVAVLKIETGQPLPYIMFGNSDDARIGEWVLAVGSPFGLARTVTAGIISQTNRETPEGNIFQRFIQTDAAINRGNSGGPLVNMDGDVIGINSQIATSTGDYNGIGFALPSNQAAYVYRQILAYGRVKRGYLGVYLDSVEKEFANVYGMGETRGAIISSVRDPEGAAAKAGLKDNDIIVNVDGKPVMNAEGLIGRIASTPPGQDIIVGYLRESGDKLVSGTVKVRLDERPGAEVKSEEPDTPRRLPLNKEAETLPFGLTLEQFTDADAAESNFVGKKGLMILRIDPGSAMAEEKNSGGYPVLGRGDLIERINRKPVADLDSFTKMVNALPKGTAVVLHVSSYDPNTGRVVPRIVQFTVK